MTGGRPGIRRDAARRLHQRDAVQPYLDELAHFTEVGMLDEDLARADRHRDVLQRTLADSLPFNPHFRAGGRVDVQAAERQGDVMCAYLAGFDLARFLASLSPVRALHVRHTVGLVDAITDGDLGDQGRAGDGLPETLVDVVRTYGNRYFKLKVGGDIVQDVARLRAIARVLDATEADTVVHTNVSSAARFGGRAEMKESNVIGTMQLFAACQRSESVERIIVRGSTAVYGAESNDPAVFTEEMARSSRIDPFGRDCSELESYARDLARRRPELDMTLFRFANILGPTADTPLCALHRASPKLVGHRL